MMTVTRAACLAAALAAISVIGARKDESTIRQGGRG
jgi:hypothetical protein